MYPYDSISGIGTNPLGTMGLNFTGAYGSYADPMSMGMMGMNGLNGMGMMGMYNPTFMKQMMDMQHEIEKSQTRHSQDMHEILTQAEVANLSAHDRAIFQKISVDGDVQRGIEILAKVVRDGDSDAIIMEYDKLKSIIYTKFAEDFRNNKTSDSKLTADRYIDMMYTDIISKQSGETVNLRDDIKKYGETAFMHGFNQAFLGNSGHNTKYSEEVLSYIDGTRINDKGSKDRAHRWGGYAERGVEGLAAAGAGAAAGLGLLGIAKTLPGIKVPFFKCAKWVGWAGAAAALAGDIWWQMSRNNA